MSSVYIDVLIFENMIMNCVILHITSKITSQKTSRKRLLAGASAGTLYAVISLWIETFFSALFGKLLLSGVMVWLAFFPLKPRAFIKKIKIFLKVSAVFYGVTFLFAGLSFALLLTGKVNNAGNILVTVCSGYLIFISILGSVRKKRALKDSGANVFIQFDRDSGGGIWLPAIVDTGNSLKDPFTGLSVIVAEFEAVKTLLPEEIMDYMSENGCGSIFDEAPPYCSANDWLKRFRLIPYRSVGQENGILPGFKADIVKISSGGDSSDEAELNDVVICLYERELSENSEYSALLAPDMIA